MVTARPRWRRARLKTTLVGLLVPIVLALLVFDVWSDYQTLHTTTDAAYDRALLGPALALSNSATVGPGGEVRLEVPQLALAMLESAPGQRMYYRVTRVDLPRARAQLESKATSLAPPRLELDPAVAQPVAGMRDLALPATWPSGVEPVFYNTVYRGDPVRVVALSRPLWRGDIWGPQLLVQVGESTSARGALQALAWESKLRRNLLIIAVLVSLLLLGVYWALRPLTRLHDDVRGRAAGDLGPLDAREVPQEIAPLVDAVNHHVQRLRHVLDAQEQFLADASHQLRTPLAIMRTQAEYALREPGTPRTRKSLNAILAQLERAGRLTAQLLTLAHARHAPSQTPAGVVDVRALAHDLTVQHLPLALARKQDLGWEDDGDDAPVPVLLVESALVEALSNVIHNAISYTPSGGRITVAVHVERGFAEISVADTGPGIPPARREHAFERFGRVGAHGVAGAGLGLAIARELITRDGGTIALADGEPNAHGGHGLRVVIRLPCHMPGRAPSLDV